MNPNECKGPLLTTGVLAEMRAALRAGDTHAACSLDLGRSTVRVAVDPLGWSWQGRHFPYPERIKDRTIYHWTGTDFAPASRFTTALIKLVPTDWGPPTFEIDGIKMLPTAHVSPYADAARKVSLIRPSGRTILDTCGGLGYFAAWCLEGRAAHVRSFEKNADVLWLRTLNPWSPEPGAMLTLVEGDISERILAEASASMDAILHDPPRFGIAGELYSQAFYNEMARVIRRKGRLFHYTGTPNRLTSGRDVPNEVAQRLRQAGFSTAMDGDGVLATRR